MFCLKCGSELPLTANFCNGCGVRVGNPESSTPRGKKKDSVYLYFGRLAGIIAVLVFVPLLIAAYYENKKMKWPGEQTVTSPVNAFESHSPSPEPPPPPPPPPPPLYSEAISNTTFTVEPLGYRYYKFTVPSHISRAKIHGTYKAEGGGNDDIRVYVMDENDFINYKKNNEYRCYYCPGRKTVDSIEVVLVPGTYYLVFSNTLALFTNKVINAKIFMTEIR